MSINAPATLTITGDAALTITVTWSVNPAGSTITVNGNIYPMNGVFDNPMPIIKDIATAGSVSIDIANKLMLFLQMIVRNYDFQANQGSTYRFNIAVA